MLDINNLTIRFGGLTAVNDVCMHMDQHKIYGIIGPNGAGKTTLFNTISGVYTPTSGTIDFNGIKISGKKPYQINKIGIARTYQVINLFNKMTVVENVLIGLHTEMESSFLKSVLHVKSERQEEKAFLEKAHTFLDFVNLGQKASLLAGNLSYGEQRLLEIVRALASNPQLLLLDEPAAGMNSAEKEELNNIVRRIVDEYGVTVLIIEHDMKMVMGLTDYIYVLNFGKKLAEGVPLEVQNNPDVINAYLGGD